MAKLKRTVIIGGASGSSGPVTFKLVRGQTFITERTSPTNPSTAGQQAARSRFTTSSRAYKAFSAAQVAAWDDYAAAATERDAITGGRRFKDGMNAYVALATKYLQVTPAGTAPTSPPATPFTAPGVTLTAVGASGKVTFTASGPLPATVRAELLLQKLASANRKPQKGAYRSKAFASFPIGGLSQDVTVPPGHYAAAYRFVNASTGQATEMQVIGVQQVTLSVELGGQKTNRKAA
ncbi:MAG TPA: hypothetical protein PLH94_13350 [Fimbriimonadaceae bacterium]|nr:hypothetical protein [Fimbriimonadaceae bacterium]